MTELFEYLNQTENYEALDQGRCYWVWKSKGNKVNSEEADVYGGKALTCKRPLVTN